LQTLQEAVISTLTEELRRSQLKEAQANLESLRAAQRQAEKRHATYSQWIAAGMTQLERAQIGLMTAGATLQAVAGGIHLGAAIAAVVPKVHIGLFIFGTDTPDFKDAFGQGAEALQSLGEALQVGGEVVGILAQHERTTQDWTLQRDLAKIDVVQIAAQITGAEWQVQSAQREVGIAARQLEHQQTLARFYRDKFTNQELYEWMVARLSELHYQSYQLAITMARAAERAFQFERGKSEAGTTFVQGQGWDSQRKGLLSGAGLNVDLQRIEGAFIAGDARRFEITKQISLIALDPRAFLKLKQERVCEFELDEALFDYDFPGHYCRQVKTIAIDLDCGEGVVLNATLTQLTNRVVMEPDSKAVAFLLEPKESAPLSLRSNWKATQQVALSFHTQYETNNGLFELRFDTERYLPFEGTGAVSRWRLELGGRPGSYDLNRLTQVVVTLKYTALQGGAAFAAAVRGLLKPTDTLRAFDLSRDFGEAWQGFLEADTDVLELPLKPALFPAMASGRIRAIFARYQTELPGAASFVLDLGSGLLLDDGKTVETPGLSVRASGSVLKLKVRGNKAQLSNAYLLLSYKASAQ
jgi:hypothetical protein